MSASDTFRQRLDNFILQQRKLLPVVYPGVDWDGETWSVLVHHIDNEKNYTRHKEINYIFKRFCGCQSERSQFREPFKVPYSDFLKAALVYARHTRRVGLSGQRLLLTAGTYLYEELFKQNVSDPTKLTREHFLVALKTILGQRSIGTAWNMGIYFESLSFLLDSEGLTPSPTHFTNPIVRPHPKPSAKGLPSDEALAVLYRIAQEPNLTKSEQIVVHIATLLRLTGMRINEVTTLPVECWIEEKHFNRKTNEESIRFGLRMWASKGGKTIPRFLPSIAVKAVKNTIDCLRLLCTEAREAAGFIESGLCPIQELREMSPEALITGTQIRSILKAPHALHISRRLRLKPQGRHKKGIKSVPVYRVSDLIQCLANETLKTPPVMKKGGIIRQTLSETLLVLFEYEFGWEEKSNGMCWKPQMLNYTQIQRAFAGGKENIGGWIFEKRGLRGSDGSPLKLRTHQFRHKVNTEAANGGPSGGLNNTELALFFNRKDIGQNAYYDHCAQERQLFTAKEIKELIDAGFLAGRLVDAYKATLNPKDQAALLEAHARQGQVILVESPEFPVPDDRPAHATALGICIHDFTASPCPYHLVCLSGCGKFLRRIGNQQERKTIKRLREFHLHELEKAEAHGASPNYIEHNRKVVAGCDRALMVDSDSSDENGEIIAAFLNEPCLGVPLVEPQFIQLKKKERNNGTREASPSGTSPQENASGKAIGTGSRNLAQTDVGSVAQDQQDHRERASRKTEGDQAGIVQQRNRKNGAAIPGDSGSNLPGRSGSQNSTQTVGKKDCRPHQRKPRIKKEA